MERNVESEILFRLGELSGKLDQNTATTQSLADRVTYLERELLPAVGKRSATYGAVGGVSSAAAFVGAIYYFGKMTHLWP